MSKCSLVKIILAVLLGSAGAFTGLKLFGVIDWSWTLVLSPFLVVVGFLSTLFVLFAWHRRSL